MWAIGLGYKCEKVLFSYSMVLIRKRWSSPPETRRTGVKFPQLARLVWF